jgi:hypothetical protein
MPSENEFRLYHLIGFGKGLIDGTGVVIPFKGKIVAKRGVDHRCSRIKRGAHVRYRIEFFIFDRNMLRGVLRLGAAAGHHGRNRFALPADAINRDRTLGRGLETFQMREDADPWRDDRGEFSSRNDGHYPRHALGCRSIYADDLCVRVWRAQEHDMRHARQLDVTDV